MTSARLLAVALTLAVGASAVAATGSAVFTASGLAVGEGTHVVSDGDRLVLESGPGRAIRGRTDLPAGTKLSVRVQSQSGEHPFLMTDETTVDRNGTFRAVVDFSDVPPDTNFSVVIHHDGTDLTETEGTVVECDDCGGRSGDAATETNFAFAGDRFTLGNGPGRAVRVRTALPAGTEVSVRLKSSGLFLKARTVTVDADGRVRAVFDLWDIPSRTEFEASVHREDRELAATGGTVVACSVQCDSPHADGESPDDDRDSSEADDLTVFSVTRGGTVRMPIGVSPNGTATLSVGGENMTYSLDAAVEDGDGDGRVTLLFDTGEVGLDRKPITVADDADAASVRHESGPSSGENVLDAGEYPLLQYRGDRPTGAPSEDRGALTVGVRSGGESDGGSDDGPVVADFGIQNASVATDPGRSGLSAKNYPTDRSVETRVGETARFELWTDEAKSATVTVGEFDRDYTLSATVRDGDGDERVVLLFNTTAARSAGGSPTLTAADPDDEVTVTTERGSFAAAEYDLHVYVGPSVELSGDLDGPKKYRLLHTGTLVVTETGTTPTLAVTEGAAGDSGPPLMAVGAFGLAAVLGVVGVALLVGAFEFGR